MSIPVIVLVSLFLITLSCRAFAQQPDGQTEFNYKLYCQGCHTSNGMGGGDVPPLTNAVGYFLNTKEGRAYLIQVPGVAFSILDDKQIAHITNWIIKKFAGASEPKKWNPYTADEVAEYRKRPLTKITSVRNRVFLSGIQAASK